MPASFTARLIIIVLFVMTHFGGYAQMGTPAPANDRQQIDSVIRGLYRVLSFTNKDFSNLEKLKSFFTADGKLIAAFGKEPLTWPVDQYIELTRQNFIKQSITNWQEIELAGKTEVFGKIAHRFSTYEIKFLSEGKETIRKCINAIQLINYQGKWLITSLAWDRENETLKIPSVYLNISDSHNH